MCEEFMNHETLLAIDGSWTPKYFSHSKVAVISSRRLRNVRTASSSDYGTFNLFSLSKAMYLVQSEARIISHFQNEKLFHSSSSFASSLGGDNFIASIGFCLSCEYLLGCRCL